MFEPMALSIEAQEQLKKIQEFQVKNGYKYTKMSFREEGTAMYLDVTYSIKLNTKK